MGRNLGDVRYVPWGKIYDQVLDIWNSGVQSSTLPLEIGNPITHSFNIPYTRQNTFEETFSYVGNTVKFYSDTIHTVGNAAFFSNKNRQRYQDALLADTNEANSFSYNILIGAGFGTSEPAP
jgi:hypothetical protein